MIEDSGLSTMEQILADFIIESGNEIDTQPFFSNMGIDENGAFYTRPEFIVMATMKSPDGKVHSCKLYPSQNAIYVDDKLVKKLAE
jgi:hypothetical protein